MTVTEKSEPKTVPWAWKPLALVATALALVFFTLWVIPGIVAEGKTKTDSEVRVCVLSKTMQDPTIDYDTAKLLCRQP